MLHNHSAVVKLRNNESLLCSPLTGAIDVVEETTLKALAKIETTGKYSSTNAEMIDYLIRRGHLSEASHEEMFMAMKNYCQAYAKEMSQIKRHIIIPTYSCNLRCTYCFEKHVLKAKSDWLNKLASRKQIDEIFKAIVKLDQDVKHLDSIVLYGGEPLQWMNADIIKYVLDRGQDLGYSFMVVTNGVELAQFVPCLSKYDIRKIQVTLDGPKEIHDKRRFKVNGKGSFDDITNGIETAFKADLPVWLRVNVDSVNLEHLPSLADFAISRGWGDSMHIFLMNVHQSCYNKYCHAISSSDFMKRVIRLVLDNPSLRIFRETFNFVYLEKIFLEGERYRPRFWSCGANTSLFIYDPHGKIYPCYESVGISEHAMGEYSPQLKFDDTVYQLWRGRTVFAIPECSHCNLSFFCGGGCAILAHTKTGSIMKPDCDLIQSIVRDVIPFLYERNETVST